MRPLIFDHLFHDDRVFVLEITPVESSSTEAVVLAPNLSSKRARQWAVVTRRNVPGYPAHRVDRFNTESEAVDFYKCTVSSTPRRSTGERPPDPVPTLEEYEAWLTRS